MTLLAIMAMYRVTQGAGPGVPFSGARCGLLTGQVTCPASLSTGADGSEPRRPPGTRGSTAGTQDTGTAVAGGAGGVPRVTGVPLSTRGARTTRGRTSAYTGCP